MARKIIASAFVFCIFAGLFQFRILPVHASGTICINEDGSVSPLDAPIERVGNTTYILMENITCAGFDGIVICAPGITFDGNKHTIQGIDTSRAKSNGIATPISPYSAIELTIRNTAITGFMNGICLGWSHESIIENNFITRCQVAINNVFSGGVIIRNNDLVNNGVAISLSEQGGCYVYDNNIEGNQFGVDVGGTYAGSYICHNNFVNNTVQAQGGVPLGEWGPLVTPSVWNDVYPSGGNFWSDYIGTDLKSGVHQNMSGGDGIGDVPYVASPQGFLWRDDNIDYYPLMQRRDLVLARSEYLMPPEASLTFSPETPYAFGTTTFDASASFSFGLITEYGWGFGDGTTSATTSPITQHAYTTVGTYNVSLTVTDYFESRGSTSTVLTVVDDNSPPVTVDDYDSLWHNSDFNITLVASDSESGVAEICYRINGNPVNTVGADGQPLIVTEGTSNTLEYWSVDNAGNEELPHKTLTGIRLDKTAPTIGTPSRTPEGAVSPDEAVRISVNVTDATSQIESVTLFWRINDSEIWTESPMNQAVADAYEATVPPQEEGTTMRFKIVASDNAGNNGTLDGIEPCCTYPVGPEFPSTLILPLTMAMTMLVAVFRRARDRRKNI